VLLPVDRRRSLEEFSISVQVLGYHRFQLMRPAMRMGRYHRYTKALLRLFWVFAVVVPISAARPGVHTVCG
jgi:hypothetical protein